MCSEIHWPIDLSAMAEFIRPRVISDGERACHEMFLREVRAARTNTPLEVGAGLPKRKRSR